ncbi:T9SS type A sorting domain-containing protein [Flavobacterium sp. J372]|uniref:T9SS type A sorting domain-containing protein n=1 Tax=Flavobacterium sp. J372 TaxID=2898436 RepID=UPI002151E2CE|nr:T9SS type A sorting domain-containing protein [Flavobacterium sp. J372]MCR5860912.1 T9SS type A sorting domain-containing protein [Flavobacterium sp. J372]
MNKLYILIALLLCTTGYTQDLQNAKWYFGDGAGLDFLPDIYNPTPVVNAQNSFEGCATVSDTQGNLLFFSNGLQLWDANENIITSALKGNGSSTSNVIFVPKPRDSTRYYVVTIDGASGLNKGLHYSEISTSGTIISLNQSLLDHNGIKIDENYNSMSEKLTSTVHADGESYWIIAQIKDKIYSYKVSNTGINATPVSSDAPVDVDVPLGEYPGIGHIKVSPNTQRIGVCYSHGITFQGFLILGDFNFITGQAVFDNNTITVAGQTQYYGLEFSPDSNYAFFSTQTDINGTAAQRGPGDNKPDMNVYSVSAAKSSQSINPELVGNITLSEEEENPEILNDAPLHGSLQLAINGYIYASSTFGSYVIQLSVITNPNDGPLAYFDPLSVLASPIEQPRIIRLGLPQWVHNNTGRICPLNIVLEGPDLMGDHIYSYTDYIHTQNGYELYGNPVIMKAGDHIVLGDDTYIGWGGADFLAIIKPCGEPVYPEPIYEVSERQYETASKMNKINTVIIYPNPAEAVATIVAQSNIDSISIYSIHGKKLYSQNIMEKNIQYTVDVSRFGKGIYLVTIQTDTGESFTSKLVVK